MRFLGSTFLVDCITFSISGAAPQRFLSLAAQKNLRLRNIRCTKVGYTAMARGVDLSALKALATHGNWQFTLLKRRGPGPLATRALRRPGVPIGILLFLVLLQLLSNYVWCIDFGTLEAEEQASLRSILAAGGIYEGARPNAEALTAVRRQIAAQSDRYGWISINFIAGCLAVETTPSRFEKVVPPVPEAALYATAEGKVLRVETESGFAMVVPGQYVAKHQLLVDCNRIRRSGTTFTQGASGAVIARITRSYSATQPLAVTAALPSGAREERLELHWMGQMKLLEGTANTSHETGFVEWFPLRIGKVALPGYFLRTTRWSTQATTLHYTPAQTAALAARACRLKLMAEFPDAVIETQQRSEENVEQGIRCTLRYTFCANIARSS